ncbi:MAG: RnfABCDGE type electron transport complex subunit D [Saccharofermentans sp.]|nr:RnfABCDGE type electron transport complex subunit D [Saccharofermentans sp.]
MNDRKLAPFIHTYKNAPYIYLTIIVALLPCVFYSWFYYGIRAIVLTSVSAILFSVSDRTFSKIVHAHNDKDYYDISSVASGVIFAMMLPPDTSLIVVVTGVLFGSIVIKQLFGGAGSNLLNPAAGARLIVEVLYPSHITGFAEGGGEHWFDFMSLVSFSQTTGEATDCSKLSFLELIAGNYSGFIGTACVLTALLGCVFMVIKGTMRLYAPISYLISLGIFYQIFVPEGTFVVFLLSSGVVFVAVFMLGDLTTMPSRFAAGAFSGLVCAFLTAVLISSQSLVIAILTPVLAVNFMSFVIDYFAKTLSRRKHTSREVDVL